MNSALQLFRKKKNQSKVVSPSPEKTEAREARETPKTSETRHVVNDITIETDQNECESFGGLLGLELPFEALYELQKKLRSGSFATVWVTKHRLTGNVFATKVIDRRKLKKKNDQNVLREVEIMRDLRGCENVINLVCFFESPETYHLVLDLAKGGDVFDRLAKRAVYNEYVARDLARNLLSALKFIHSRGIAHRDLKPENLLLVDENDDTNLKVADFGFAKKIDSRGLSTRCGTPAFVAPEIIRGVRYNHMADNWSVGAIIYFLLGGYPPFQADNHNSLFRKIRAADFIFHDKYWGNISLEAKQLISLLLVVDPKERIDSARALKHDWLKVHDHVLQDNHLPDTVHGFKKFCAKRKLKGAAIAVSYAVSANFWNTQFVSFSHMSELPHSSSMYKIVGLSSKTSVSSALTSAHRRSRFSENFILGKKVKGGTFSTVWEATCMVTKKLLAVKIVSRKNLSPNDDAQVLNEVAILKSLKHKSVVRLIDFFEDREKFFLVMELFDGGDVFDRIVQRNHYSEKDARDLAKALLEGVSYLHSHHVAHRDLKPQNLLLASKDDDADVKIADFGFAKRVHTPNSLLTRCGTPTYVAPEILKNHPHDNAADMWSIGVIIFVLLVGYPPFMEQNQRLLFQKVRMGEFEFFEPDWEGISEEAKNLISDLLVVDPQCRITAQTALRHPWITGDDSILASRDLSNSLTELKKYVEENNEY